MRKLALIILVQFWLLTLIATGFGCKAQSGKEVTVGNKNFTEQYIVGQLIKQLLENRGFTVELKSGHTSSSLREAMEFGDIDICTEYSGTAWMVHLGQKYKPGMDRNEVYRLVKKEEDDNGLIWLKPMWNNNTYALASWPQFAQKHGLRTISDLAALYREKQGKIKTSVGLEFSTRSDGLPALENHYNFKVAQPYIMTKPVAAPKQSLEKGLSDVAMVFGTDPEVAKYRWHVYMDDKNFFPPYDLVPYVRKEVLDTYPEIADILNELVATFPGGGEPSTPEIVAECQKVWQELNAKVDIKPEKEGMKRMEPDEVAHEYLVKHGLI
jgi:osmoprotectant transport system substrate-binding protein